MCGFAGFIDFKGAGDEQLVEAMAATLIHRGPDDAGTAFFREQDTVIGLGFRRLSIIDLSPAGHQPMHSGNQQVTIMMNGEVYNYASIRKELEQEGCSFRSGSDTEVVLQAYCRWGISALSKFIGMFAIVLLDRSSKQLILIRDRAGVKPLFYHVHPSGVLFGSELKASGILRSPKKLTSDRYTRIFTTAIFQLRTRYLKIRSKYVPVSTSWWS